MNRKQNPYTTPTSSAGGETDDRHRTSTFAVWPNALFAMLFVAFFANILHLYETEENTYRILCWSPLPIGFAGVIAFIVALVQNVKRNRTIMAIAVVPFGLFLMAYMWMIFAPQFS